VTTMERNEAPPLPPGERLLSAETLAVGYDGRAILPPLTMTIRSGELWAVIGPNGAGKSTFVVTALGLIPPVSGATERRPGLRLAYVPQQAALDAIFPISVLDFVVMGLQRRGSLIIRGGGQLDRARTALDEAGARAFERRQLRDLSGGERQRVLLARAMASNADLVFLDEPTAALDLPSEREILGLIGQLRARRGAAVVMVTHLVEDGLERADRALLLDRDHGVALVESAAAIRDRPELHRIYGRFAPRAPAEA
jgi:zinc transport system ATP-binding protein